MSHLDFTLSLIDKLTRPLKTAQSSLSGFAEKSQASFTKIGIGAAAVWGVAQSIAGVVGPAYEMNAALAEVGSKGVAEDALKRLSGEAMRFSMRYGKGAVDVVRSSYAMKGAMAGLSDLDLPRVTIAANTLAAGVKASGEEAGEYIGVMASRFNAELSSLGHVRFAEELAGKTAYMVQNFGVKMQTMQELIEGTKSAGADFGVSLDEQFAVLGTLSRTLGTEASGIYEQFLRSAPAAAEKLGMSFVDATGKMLPMGDILQKLQSKYGQSIEGNVKAQQALDAAFGGGADVIKKLYGQQNELNRSITELGRNDGMKRAQEMAAQMAEPWERIKASFFAIRVAIGNTLIPILSPLMNGVADVGTRFARWLDMFPNIARWLGYITLGVLSFGLAGAATNIVMGVFGFTMMGLAGIAKVLGGTWKALLWTFNMLRPSLLTTRIGLAALWVQSKLLALWAGVCRLALVAWNVVLQAGAVAMRVYGMATMFAGVAMQVLTSPITLIIAALALLAVGVWYVVTHWEKLTTALMDTKAFEWVMAVARQVGQVFADVWASITEGFTSAYSWIVEKLNKLPGVNIDIKADMPQSVIAASAAAAPPKMTGAPLLTGGQINADIPRGGLMSQVKSDSKTAVDNRKTWGDTYITAPNGITPAQLAEWQELNAG
ncbi:phage tail tape measure protein [Salmonella enterica]|nr:phage tail tape measure protein [Salmonella enterica]